MLFFAVEKVSSNDPFIIGVRERFYINKMNVIEQGLNKYKTKKYDPELICVLIFC